MDPLARIGAYFRDHQLQKALSIVVLPGQATGKVEDVVDILQSVEASNRLVPIGTLADCQDNVAKWWCAVFFVSAYSMLDQENDPEKWKLHKIIECVPYKLSNPSKSNEKMGSYENKLGCVIKATMESFRMIGDSSFTMKERLATCDDGTSILEEITENLTQRQEEQCQLESKEEKMSNNFSVLKVVNKIYKR